MLSDNQFKRYQRQIALEQIGETGQEALLNSHVLIIGCGGLGSVAIPYLVGAGIGNLVWVDDDRVEEHNLHRQISYRHSHLDIAKVTALKQEMAGLNPDVKIRTIDHRLDANQLALEIMLADVILDCTDNLPARQMINRLCLAQKTPLVSGAAIGWQGQLAVFQYGDEQACYHCYMPEEESPELVKCSELGVMGPVVGIVGVAQSLKAIQLLLMPENVSVNRLDLFDGLSGQWQSLTLVRDTACSVCAGSEFNSSKERD